MGVYPAARVGDMQKCSMVEQVGVATIPHVGGPILPPGASTVLIGGKPAARAGDKSLCVPAAKPNTITEGAPFVQIEGKAAARWCDRLEHGANHINDGCLTVLIGDAGLAGNVRVGTIMCEAAAAGRESGKKHQSYHNCAVESARMIINQATGRNVTEKDLLQWALDNGYASRNSATRIKLPTSPPGTAPTFHDGGMSAIGTMNTLALYGVVSTIQTNSLENLKTALSNGKGVIANIDAHHLPNRKAPPGSLHSVTVTGIEYGGTGNVVSVIINDTGRGICGEILPVDCWNKAEEGYANETGRSAEIIVTSDPIF